MGHCLFIENTGEVVATAHAADTIRAAHGRAEQWRDACVSLVLDGSFGTRYAMPYENNQPIYICGGPGSPLEVIWPTLWRFNEIVPADG
jgi:hypothetical protein